MTDKSQAMIEARGLSKFYGEFAAVQHVTFSVSGTGPSWESS